MEQATQTASKVLDPNGNPVQSGGALMAQPVRIDAGRLDLLDPDLPDEAAFKELERRAVFIKRGIQYALQQTAPSQYVVHRSEDGQTESVYPMGAAGAAMLRFFGLTWAVPEPVTDARGQVTGYRPGDKLWRAEVREVGEKTRYCCVESALWRGTDLIALCEGKRLIGGGYSKDDVQSGQNAFENLKSRAVRTVLGLGGKDRAWYLANGLDLSTARVVDFQDRASGASSDPAQAVIKWGKAKGQKVSELSDEDLRFYTERQEKDVADPAKAKYHPERLLAALKAEAERRAAKPTEDAAQAEEYERTIVAVREEMVAQRVEASAMEKYIATMKTLDQAKKALETYRKRRTEKRTA